MKNVNRVVMIVVLLLAIVVCGLVIRNMDAELRASQTQIVTLQSQVSTLETAMKSFQATTTQEIDDLNADITALETLVNDLGLQVAN